MFGLHFESFLKISQKHFSDIRLSNRKLCSLNIQDKNVFGLYFKAQNILLKFCLKIKNYAN